MQIKDRELLSGDEAVALAALDAGVHLATGYPGTPSTEILEALSALGGRAQWAPNEKVAMEVGVGVAFGGGSALVTMKHVGVNVAADALFTVAYTGVSGALVLLSADDPGMSSSQNEQDNRRYAVAAGVPMFEPADSQDAYDLMRQAVQLSHRWQMPVLFRMTTRVCHSKSIVNRAAPIPALSPNFVRDIPGRVMIPGYARPAHKRLREKLAVIADFNEKSSFAQQIDGGSELGIVSSGVASLLAREAAPSASHLKLSMTYPLPLARIRRFVQSVKRCIVIEEGDPYLVDALRAEGMNVEGKPPRFRLGELNVERVRKIIDRDESDERSVPRGKPPELCPACPYHPVYAAIRKLDCIVAGDIGCYSLGVLPPYQAMDSLVCMGAALGVGLGLRHVLPEDQAKRVVSVIGDSTFVHSGITGLVEMVYNPPATGHVVLILDNGTTAMTGQQEHPATGRTLAHEPTGKLRIEDLCRVIGVDHVDVVDPRADAEAFERLLRDRLQTNKLSVIIARKPCILAAGKIREYEQRTACSEQQAACAACS